MRKQAVFALVAVAAAVVLVVVALGYALGGNKPARVVRAAPRPAVTVTAPAPRAHPRPRVTVTRTAAPAAPAQPAAPAAPAPQAAPADVGYLNAYTLEVSLATENANVLDAAPSYDYSGGNAQVTAYCTPEGSYTFSCSATDSDGDSSAWNDTVTVSSDGSAWSDTGMNWSGPDIYVDGGATDYWTVPAVYDYSS